MPRFVMNRGIGVFSAQKFAEKLRLYIDFWSKFEDYHAEPKHEITTVMDYFYSLSLGFKFRADDEVYEMALRYCQSVKANR